MLYVVWHRASLLRADDADIMYSSLTCARLLAVKDVLCDSSENCPESPQREDHTQRDHIR